MPSLSTLWRRNLKKNFPKKYQLFLTRQRVKMHLYLTEQRRKAIEILGGKCARCGFADSRALQIDHVNGGGTIEIRAIQNSGIWRKILDGNTSGYQLLCANCNWIKRVENHEYRKCRHVNSERELLDFGVV